MAFEPVDFAGGETYDGDTVYKGGQGFRLYGIDADEMKEHGILNQPTPSPQAIKAKEYLDGVMNNEKVSFEDMGSDKYGRRVVRILGEDGRDVNEELVRQVGVNTIDFDGVSPYHAAAVAFEDDVRAGRKILDRAVPFNTSDYIPERTIAQELGTGYDRGKDQLGLMLGKSLETIGESLGVESLQQRGLDMSSKYLEELVKPDQAPQVGTYKDVDGVKSAALYAAGLLGEQVPQLMADAAAFAGGAATGAGVGGIGAVAARRGVAAAAARIGMNIGGRAGAFSSMYSQSLGESVMEQESEGVDDNPLAYATAFAKAGADYIGAKAMLKTSKRMMLDGNEVSARVVAGEAMRSIGAEGLTESFQTMLDKAAIAYKKDGYDLLSDDNIDEAIDSFFAGAIVGGSVSGAGAGVRKTYDRFFGAKDEKTPDAVEQSEDVPPAEEKMPEAEPSVADVVSDTEASVADVREPLQPTVSSGPEPVSQGVDFRAALEGLNLDGVTPQEPSKGRLPRVQIPGQSWVNDNAQADRDLADRMGVTARIEELFADGKTASEVRTALKKEGLFRKVAQEDETPFVVNVRATLGIPSRMGVEGEAEFQQWKAARDSRAEAPSKGVDFKAALAGLDSNDTEQVAERPPKEQYTQIIEQMPEAEVRPVAEDLASFKEPVDQQQVSFERGTAKAERGVEKAQTLFEATPFDAPEEKPVTANAASDTSSRVDFYEGSASEDGSSERAFDPTTDGVDSVTAAQQKMKRSLSDAISRGLRSSEAMKQRYRQTHKDEKTGERLLSPEKREMLREYERKHGVGSASGMRDDFIASPAYQRKRNVRMKFPGDSEWHDVDFRALLTDIYNNRDIDTTEQDPVPHRRIMNQLSYVIGELAEQGIEIDNFDPESTIVWRPTKDLQDLYMSGNRFEGSTELTLADIAEHEKMYNSANEKVRSKYRKGQKVIMDFDDDFADKIDELNFALKDAEQNKKDPDVPYMLARAIRAVGGEAESKDVDGLLAEGRYALAQAQQYNETRERRKDEAENGEAGGDGDASQAEFTTLAAEARSRESSKDFFGEVSVSTKRGKKKADSGATQPVPESDNTQVKFSFASDVSANFKDAVRTLVETMGLKADVIVQEGPIKRAVPGTIDFKEGKVFITLDMGRIAEMSSNKYDVATTVVAHELGHAWMQEKGHRVPDAALKELYDGFKAARKTAPAGHVYRKQKGVGFDEWIADQFMAYVINSNKAPKTATAKYFAKVWKALSAIVDTLGKALFGRDRFSRSDVGTDFVESVFRTSMNKQGITDNRFDSMLADAYEELFGLDAGKRVGQGERRAQTELRAVGDTAAIAKITALEKQIFRAKEQIAKYRRENNTVAVDNYQKRLDVLQADLRKISATEPRDFYARAVFHKYGGVQGAKRLMSDAASVTKNAAEAISPVWATSIRRLKQKGHNKLAANYEKFFTDQNADMRTWMAELDKVSDADLHALSLGKKTASVTRFLDQFYSHIKRDGGMPTLGKISKDYVPRMFDRVAIEEDKAQFRNYIQQEAKKAGYPMSDKEADDIIAAILKDDSAYYQLDNSGGASFAGNAASRSLNFINDLDLQTTKWVIQDKRMMMAGYVNSMLKRSNYERHFGGYNVVVEPGKRHISYVRHFMKNVPFRAETLGISGGAPGRLATSFEKEQYFEKADTASLMKAVQSANARGWVTVELNDKNEPTVAIYEPSYMQNMIIRRLREDNKEADVKEFMRVTDALSGRLGQDSMSPTARKITGGLMTYQNILTLLFATLSSFPDAVGPIVRSRDFAGAREALRGMMEVIGGANARERRKLMHDLGVAHRSTTEQALLEVYGAEMMPATLKRINDKFFQYTGLEAITAFSRIMAGNVGIRFIQRHAKQALDGDAESKRYLSELGLTPDDANSLNKNEKMYSQMLADGTAFDSHGNLTPEAQLAEKIQKAVNQFVDESVVRPDASQRPVWASDPRFMLVWHLKSFAYSYAKVIMKPVFKEAVYQFNKNGISPQVAVPLVVFALPVMLASALGLRLREFIQYDVPHGLGIEHFDGPSAQREFDEYLYDVLRRGGILGPAELAVNAMEADDRKRSALVTLLGPTADHLNTLLQFDAYKAVTRSVPVLSQMPEFKAAVYGAMN